jgi:tetratricopeptide (TPR) repeat protein
MRAGWTLAGFLVASAAAAYAEGGAASREPLFRALGSETLADRTEAARSLEKADGLTEDEVRAALAAAPRLAKPHVLRLAAARRMKGLVPDIVACLAAQDPVVTDAAARALVSLGDDAASAGIRSLAASTDPDAQTVRTHLTALAARRMVERDVVGQWRRKGGTYEGRFKVLAKYGWPVQPILLAMLLDVPVCDHQIVLPETDDQLVLDTAKADALADIERSDRRGYRTFEPLPVYVEQEELFDLAQQALRDVADLEFMGDILERVSENLEDVDELRGWRLRPWEEGFYRDIDIALYWRGRPDRLERYAEKRCERVQTTLSWLERAEEVGKGADQRQQIRIALDEYASALHQLGRYDDAAACFKEANRYYRKDQGKDSAITGYNRACALNRAGHRDEALRQLDQALDRDRSSGAEDLTKEWVTEDGDLATLHDDPRFREIIRKRFDEPDADGGDPAGVRPRPPEPAPPPVKKD